jgi:hypothetical protein
MKAVVVGIALTLLAAHTHAKLEPIADEELSQYTGQAFLQIDNNNVGNTDFTRFTFGMDVETLLTSDLVELGRYERSGEPAGSSDIRINDFALGSINADGSINPFKIRDPFVELAYETVGSGANAQENLVGVRLGFGEAFGKLTGNIEYLTGNIEVEIYGKGSYLASQMDCGWDFIVCGTAKSLVGGAWADDDFAAQAVLINPSNGEPDGIRATHVGMQDGQTLSIPNSSRFTNFLLGLFSSSNCELLNVQTCFPLSIYRTLDIGNRDTGAPAQGMFMSFQTKTVTWYDGGNGTNATQGAFMNIPNGGIRTSFQEAFDGTERVRTKFLDPYYD